MFGVGGCGAGSVGGGRIIAPSTLHSALALRIGQADEDELFDAGPLDVQPSADLLDQRKCVIGVGDIQDGVAALGLLAIGGREGDEYLIIPARHGIGDVPHRCVGDFIRQPLAALRGSGGLGGSGRLSVGCIGTARQQQAGQRAAQKILDQFDAPYR